MTVVDKSVGKGVAPKASVLAPGPIKSLIKI